MEEPQKTPQETALHNDERKVALGKYAAASAVRIILLIVSRSFMIAITFCLVTAVTLFIMTVAGSGADSLWPYLWLIAFWPWALTGKSEFTEADFGTLVLGWGLVIAVISFMFSKLNPRFHIRRRYVLGIISLPFLADAVTMPLIVKPDDIAFFEIMLVVMYVVCCGSLVFMWVLEMVANSLVKIPPDTKATANEPWLS